MRWTINLDSYPSRRSPTNSVEEAYIVYHLLGHVFGGIVVMQRDVEAGDAVGHVADGAEVVAGEEEGEVHFAFEGLDKLDELLLADAVDAGGGFVEEQELGAGGQGAGDEDALLLASRKFAERGVGEFAEAGAIEEGFDEAEVFAVEVVEHSGFADEAHLDRLAYVEGELDGDGGSLREVADDIAARDGFLRGEAIDEDGASRGLMEAEKEAE